MSDVEELANLWNTRFSGLEKKVNDLLQSQNQTGKSAGDVNMPIYKCRGKDCGYATEDIGDLMLHTVEHHTPKPAQAAEPAEEVEPPKKRHITVDDYLNCPDCFPKFEKAFLGRGYRPPEKPAEKKAEKALPI